MIPSPSAPPVRQLRCNNSSVNLVSSLLLPALCLMLTPLVCLGQDKTESAAMARYYQGYYLQHEQLDLEKALEAYRDAKRLSRDSSTTRMIDRSISRLRENLATSDFATLMPANAFAYVEISQPANHVEQIAKLMGLTGRNFSDNDDRVVVRIEDGLALSSDFQISPALLRELKKFRGAAVAVTGVSDRGPKGVAVINPGDSDLLTGVLETGIQLVPSEKRIKGFPTFQIENEVWIVKTTQLIVASTEREEIARCIARISNPSAESLAENKKFQLARASNKGAGVFAFVNPASAFEQFGPNANQEMAIAKMALDIDHMNFVSLAIRSTDSGAQARLDVDYQEEHQSLAYGLIRTAPLSKNALKHLPSEAVGVVGIGINPKVAFAAQAAGGRYLSALDIGREFFANMEEVGLFVLPIRSRNTPIPDVGLVIASSDIEKSEQLWTTLLELPAKMNVDRASVEIQEIEGIRAHVFQMPQEAQMPPLVVARLNDQSMIAGTRNAVQVAISSAKNGSTLANDTKAKTLFDATNEHTAKAGYLRVGRAFQMASQFNRGSDAEFMRAFSEVADDMNITLVVNEAPTHFATIVNANNLPTFESMVKMMAKMEQGFASGRTRERRVNTAEARADRASVAEEVQPSYSDRVYDRAVNERAVRPAKAIRASDRPARVKASDRPNAARSKADR